MKEYEKYLKEIYDDFKNQKAEKIKIVCRDSIQKANIDYLIENGLVKSTGIQKWMDGSTHYFLMPTYEGLHYDEFKNEMNEKQIQTISNVYNNYEGKMNINSVDNSNNVNNDVEVFDKMLEKCAKSGINDIQIINAIKEMKECQDKEALKQKIIDFTQIASNCMAILQPFLPCLLKMI